MSESDERSRRLRYSAYGLLIVISCSAMVGRILTVSADHGRTPFLSANDRSRWCTIRSLVDHGTYEIDEVIRRDPNNWGPDWDTIDKVRHRGADGKQHSYSSKPTLLPTLLAGQYWIIQRLTGASLQREPFYVARAMLVVTNVLPLLIYFLLMAGVVERYGKTDWGRLFVMGSVTFGTFLTTFSVTLNNHLPAAISVAITIAAAIAIYYHDRRDWWLFVLAGLFAAFTAANELPALSFFCGVAVALLWKSPVRTIALFVPAAAIVVGGFFYTNQLAHDSWRPAYMHRSDGELLKEYPLEAGQTTDPEQVVTELRSQMISDLDLSEDSAIQSARILKEQWKGEPVAARFELNDPESEQRFAVLLVDSATQRIQVHAWGQWYEYPGSYWFTEKVGVDRGEPNRAAYAFHLTVGHHGLLSLTPIWLLALVGMFALLFFREPYDLRAVALLILLLTAVCLAFYIARPEIDRNYGGVTCGLRWMFWFTPLWLICLIPAADKLSVNRWLQGVGLIALAVSVYSAHYASLNPWTHPWAYNYLRYLGWVE